jgi:hypothetical protein
MRMQTKSSESLHRIDSLAASAYTRASFLQAREAGKAVQIGRGPATVIG